MKSFLETHFAVVLFLLFDVPNDSIQLRNTEKGTYDIERIQPSLPDLRNREFQLRGAKETRDALED